MQPAIRDKTPAPLLESVNLGLWYPRTLDQLLPDGGRYTTRARARSACYEEATRDARHARDLTWRTGRQVGQSVVPAPPPSLQLLSPRRRRSVPSRPR